MFTLFDSVSDLILKAGQSWAIAHGGYMFISIFSGLRPSQRLLLRLLNFAMFLVVQAYVLEVRDIRGYAIVGGLLRAGAIRRCFRRAGSGEVGRGARGTRG